MKPVRLRGSPGYALTPRAERRLDEAAARIYRTRPSTWDGQWHLVVLEELPARPAREELTSSLKLLGYGELGPVTWVAPRRSAELGELLGTENIAARTFFAAHEGSDVELAARAWDLGALGAEYEQFVAEWQPRLSAVDPASPPAAFAASQELLHAWRKFLFRDPGLPPQLLPPDWPGHTAARFFDSSTQKLAGGATAFLDSCLD
ncbi:phenylacetic acid degradation operon negative regulatory protein [Crossiella equi]|uniref:Phenylacetic acid degradation operon negative regulatory protein n=1 Tax=Crossiella equi TaxID=130796 RepID=A0ABS5AIR5_9PSEU|nr:phenylacetic acid degradation operon negative regulatory protein [Crossiella equi]